MIKPSVGRVVWFHFDAKSEVQAAIIARVWGDRMVNLSVLTHDGNWSAFTSVQLLQDDDKPSMQQWAEWMPYQIGQAKAAS